MGFFAGRCDPGTEKRGFSVARCGAEAEERGFSAGRAGPGGEESGFWTARKAFCPGGSDAFGDQVRKELWLSYIGHRWQIVGEQVLE